MSTNELPCIVVAGTARVGKTTLCKSVTGCNSEQSSSTYNWTIDTKYYKANVTVNEPSPADATSSIGTPEALVLVFSLTDFASLRFVKTLCNGLDLEAIEVKLLCGTHADLLSATSTEPLDSFAQHPSLQDAFEWSIESGFEFIACCPVAPTQDAALVLDGDRQGVARVVEALQAHTWPSLVMHQQPKASAVAPLGLGEESSSAVASAVSDNTDSAAPSAVSAPDQASVAGHIQAEAAVAAPPLESGQMPAGIASKWESGHFAAAPVSQGAIKATAATPPLELGQEEPTPAVLTVPEPGPLQDVGAGDEDSSREARALDGFEKLLAEMQGHKARLGTLSDRERREQAEALVRRAMEAMDFCESGSSGEEDERT